MYVREDIRDTSPQSLKKLNDTLSALWFKLFGDVSLSDLAKDVKQELYSNWLQPQGEGNLDANHPLFIRFYVPSNTKSVKQAKLNIVTSNYRLDSDVTSAATQTVWGGTTTSGSGGASTSSSGGSATSSSGGNHNHDIFRLANEDPFPAEMVTNFYKYYANGVANLDLSILLPEGYQVTNFDSIKTYTSSGDHVHTVGDHTHTIGNHTHEVITATTTNEHSHNQNMAIIESETVPSGVKIYINENLVGTAMNGTNVEQNDINILDFINIGTWNIIKVTSENIARVTAYGIVELLQNYK